MAQEQSVLPRANELLERTGRPAQVIEHPLWIAARDSALALITANRGLVLLLGPPGSGKTTLLRSLVPMLAEAGQTWCLLDYADNQSDVGLARVVLVDEADRISAARLDDLIRDGRSVVLAALPSGADRFGRYPGAAVIRLGPLAADQARAFLAERLAQLGLPRACLTESAWAGLIARASGVPRLLIALLGMALFVAAEADAERVTSVHVDRAVAVRNGEVPASGSEPAPAEPEPARPDLPGFIAARAAEPVGADRSQGEPSRWGGRVAAAIAAICLFAAAALLILGGRGHHERTLSPRPATPAVVEPGGPAHLAATPEPVAVSAPSGIVSAPSAGPAQPPSPAPPLPPAAALPGNAVARQPPPPAPAPPAAAGTTPELPAGASIHVVLIYPRGDLAAARRGHDLARALQSDGFGVGDPFPAASREARRGISYYFAQDAHAAGAIGRRLGGKYGEGRLVELPRGAGLPRPGTIEIAVGRD